MWRRRSSRRGSSRGGEWEQDPQSPAKAHARLKAGQPHYGGPPWGTFSSRRVNAKVAAPLLRAQPFRSPGCRNPAALARFFVRVDVDVCRGRWIAIMTGPLSKSISPTSVGLQVHTNLKDWLRALCGR